MKNKFFIILLIFLNIYIFAQNSNANKIMESGLTNFSNRNYTLALSDFRNIILNSENESLHGTAYYWIARSYMAQNLLDKAENNLDFFIQNFSGNNLYSDAVYQKARLLFRKGQYDNSIQIFYKFIEKYGDHPYSSNSYFWIAESLFFLGHLEEAERIYTMIIREYPNSYKLEASKYKLSLITLKFRENELLKLLKISHEEYLKALEDFQRREKTYEQSISDYQRRLLAGRSENEKNLIEEISTVSLKKDEDLAALKKEIIKLNNIITNLKEQLSDSNVSIINDIQSDTDLTTNSLKSERLLVLKDSALNLKEFYINWLASRIGE